MNYVAYFLLLLIGILIILLLSQLNEPTPSKVFFFVAGISLIIFSSIGLYKNW